MGSRPGPELTRPPRLWPVFAAYVAAFATIVVFSILAAGVVRGMYPDHTDREVLDGLPGLLAGGIAASLALVLTVLAVERPVTPARLRLRPGSETGLTLVVMIAGMLALGQALDSLTMLAGLGQEGAMAAIRNALGGASGAGLFGAVLVIGPLAGTAEELFFRGYMQTRLGEQLPPRAAVVVTSVCFGLLHLDWLHALLAFALGLYLGFVVELSGSVLPAIVCHVVNNAVFTVLTATVGAVEGVPLNAALLGIAGPILVGAVLWLRRAGRPR